jgi:hypothetical protein
MKLSSEMNGTTVSGAPLETDPTETVSSSTTSWQVRYYSCTT